MVCKVEKSGNRYNAWSADGTKYTSEIGTGTRKRAYESGMALERRVGKNDNVLIYYAGHGYLDSETDEGFWLPVDADPQDESNWLLTDRVRSKIKVMPFQ